MTIKLWLFKIKVWKLMIVFSIASHYIEGKGIIWHQRPKLNDFCKKKKDNDKNNYFTKQQIRLLTLNFAKYFVKSNHFTYYRLLETI